MEYDNGITAYGWDSQDTQFGSELMTTGLHGTAYGWAQEINIASSDQQGPRQN